jgi:hypothetical protein
MSKIWGDPSSAG